MAQLYCVNGSTVEPPDSIPDSQSVFRSRGHPAFPGKQDVGMMETDGALPYPAQPDSWSKHLWQLSTQAVPENVEAFELSHVAELGLRVQVVSSDTPSLHRLGEGIRGLAVKASCRPAQQQHYPIPGPMVEVAQFSQ